MRKIAKIPIRHKREISNRRVLSDEERNAVKQARLSKRRIVMIDGIWGIEFIPMNVIVIKNEVNRKGDIKVSRLAYCATLDRAVLRLYEMMSEEKVISSSIYKVEDLRDAIAEISQHIIDTIKNLKEVVNAEEGDTEEEVQDQAV